MKKLILITLFTVIAFTSCKSDDDDSVDCNALTQDVLDKASAYSENQNEVNCNAYEVSLQALVDTGCQTDEQDDIMEQIIAGLNCE